MAIPIGYELVIMASGSGDEPKSGNVESSKSDSSKAESTYRPDRPPKRSALLRCHEKRRESFSLSDLRGQPGPKPLGVLTGVVSRGVVSRGDTRSRSDGVGE